MIQHGGGARDSEAKAVANTLRTIYTAGIRGTGEGISHSLVPAADGIRTRVDFVSRYGEQVGVVAGPDEVHARIEIEGASVQVPTKFGFVTTSAAHIAFRAGEAVVDTGHLDQDGARVELPVQPELLGTVGRLANHFKGYQPSGRQELDQTPTTTPLRRVLGRHLAQARDSQQAGLKPYVLQREGGSLLRLIGLDPYGDVATAMVHMPANLRTGDIAIDMVLGSRGNGMILPTEEGDTPPTPEPGIVIYPEGTFIWDAHTDNCRAILPSGVRALAGQLYGMRPTPIDG